MQAGWRNSLAARMILWVARRSAWQLRSTTPHVGRDDLVLFFLPLLRGMMLGDG